MYMKAVLGKEPYLFIPYGQMALNILRQHFRYGAHPLVSYRRVRAGVRNDSFMDPDWLEAEELQPWYDNNAVFQTQPGTMITFDWDNAAVLAPAIRATNFAAGFWPRISRTGAEQTQYVGYLLDGSYDSSTIPMGLPDLLSGFTGLSGADIVGRVIPPPTSTSRAGN